MPRNRTALIAVAAAIAALIEQSGMSAGLIARGLRNAALGLLRPAESALRRLIVFAARGLEATTASRPVPTGAFGAKGAQQVRFPAFRLFDRHKRFALRRKIIPQNGIPRIRTFWGPSVQSPLKPVPVMRPALPAMVDATRLRLRLGSLEQALADLPAQARRLARWQARQREKAQEKPGAVRQPLRLGPPPGFRLRPDREIDHVLRECHTLALAALRADTS